MESPLAVANFFIKKALGSGASITPMKLIKLVYIAHGWHLGLSGEPLLPEGVQAWRYGPVIPSLYGELKKYGSSDIQELVCVLSPDMRILYPQVQDEQVARFLDKIWDIYGKLDGLQLSSLTHQEDTPWSVTWLKNKGKDMMGAVIPNELIRAHYEQKLAAGKARNESVVA